jgi:hypothetical protein
MDTAAHTFWMTNTTAAAINATSRSTASRAGKVMREGIPADA